MNAEIAVQPEQWSMVVLYDEATGTILHSHQVVTTRGGEHPDERALEDEARELGGPAAGRASALHVDPRTLDFRTHFRVDPETRRLVAVRSERDG